MARAIIQLDYGCSREEAERKAVQILTNDGYSEAEQDGEMIWMKGDVKLSGWIKGLVGGETPLHGIAGAVTKRDVKKTMKKIEMSISKN